MTAPVCSQNHRTPAFGQRGRSSRPASSCPPHRNQWSGLGLWGRVLVRPQGRQLGLADPHSPHSLAEISGPAGASFRTSDVGHSGPSRASEHHCVGVVVVAERWSKGPDRTSDIGLPVDATPLPLGSFLAERYLPPGGPGGLFSGSRLATGRALGLSLIHI